MKMKILTNEEVHLHNGLAQAILNMNGRLDLPNRLWFVVFKDNKWVAYGGYREVDNNTVYLGPTFVSENFRGMGLQKKMIRGRLLRAKKEGYKEAVSSIYTYNYISGNNLLSEGFRLTKIPSYYDIELDEVWFKKTL